jgi:hypothetical protein
MRFSLSLAMLALLATLCAGCASDGTMTNPFSSEPEPTTPHYFSEFSDIPIPNEMSESASDTFITFAPSGLKTGVQRFTGRVELVSLMNSMRRNMAANGWTLRSLLRAKRSVLVLDKPDRMAILQVADGAFTTEMVVTVTSRLEGDAPVSEPSFYTPPSAGQASHEPLPQ